MKLRVLSLFAGIGGFDLGLERTGGFQTVAFCEIEPFCQRVLAKHWPKVPCYDDVKTLTATKLAADGIAVDVICGGFPCQDISVAGSGAGLAGERSGLWSEIARLVSELRPRFVFVENVSALLSRGLGDVLRDLAALGYDAEWHCIPASAVGAPHHRDRIWIVGWPSVGRNVANAEQIGAQRHPNPRIAPCIEQGCVGLGQGWQTVADTCDQGLSRAGTNSQRRSAIIEPCDGSGENAAQMADSHAAFGERNERTVRSVTESAIPVVNGWWQVEPDVGRVAHGVPARSHRLAALGNAVVPQIPELIGNAILESMAA